VITHGPGLRDDESGWVIELRNQDLNNDNTTSLLPDAYAACVRAG
jgi:hypothetical protein